MYAVCTQVEGIALFLFFGELYMTQWGLLIKTCINETSAGAGSN